MIERALREIHFSVDPMRSAKQQALAAIPKLRAIFPIKRAAMRFKFVVGHEWFDKTIQFLESGAVLDAVVERATKNTNNSESEIVCVADPSAYRLCDAYARDDEYVSVRRTRWTPQFSPSFARALIRSSFSSKFHLEPVSVEQRVAPRHDP